MAVVVSKIHTYEFFRSWVVRSSLIQRSTNTRNTNTRSSSCSFLNNYYICYHCEVFCTLNLICKAKICWAMMQSNSFCTSRSVFFVYCLCKYIIDRWWSSLLHKSALIELNVSHFYHHYAQSYPLQIKNLVYENTLVYTLVFFLFSCRWSRTGVAKLRPAGCIRPVNQFNPDHQIYCTFFSSTTFPTVWTAVQQHWLLPVT